MTGSHSRKIVEAIATMYSHYRDHEVVILIDVGYPNGSESVLNLNALDKNE